MVRCANRDEADSLAEYMAALDDRQRVQREFAELSRDTALRQRQEAIRRRDEARQRAGQRIGPMWRARSAAYDRFSPVMAVWVGGREADPAAAIPQVEDLVGRLFGVSLLIANCQSMTSGPVTQRLQEAVALLDRLIHDVRQTLSGDGRAEAEGQAMTAAPRAQRHMADCGEISEALLRGAEIPDVLPLVVAHARTILDGRDAWIADPAAAADTSPGPRPAVEVPITSNGELVGVLCVASDGSALSDGDLPEVERFAFRISLMISLAQDRADRESRLLRTAEQLQHALDSRVVVEQAKGILSAELQIGLPAAFERMRQHARSHNATVQDIAAAVVNVGLRP